MRRIIISLAIIGGAVSALAIGSTGSFFSDTETSTGNTFAAGDIDLQIDNTSYITSTSTGRLEASPANTWTMNNLTNQLFFSFTDVKPGDIGEDTISIHAGSNDAWACMAAKITATPENSLVDPETDAGDVGPANGNNGELQNYLNFTFWKDDGDNVFEVGEELLPGLTGSASTTFNGNWLPIADAQHAPPLSPISTTYIGKAWCFGTLTPNGTAQDNASSTNPITRGTTGFTCSGVGNQNVAQTDGIVVDVSFQAIQSRNNYGFMCENLPPLGDGIGDDDQPTIGADLSSYVPPTDEMCDVHVSNGGAEPNTIAEGIAAAGAGETVCVAAGVYPEDVVVNKDITLAGAGSGTTLIFGQTAGEAGAVVITADGATVEGFRIWEATNGIAALRISGARTGITVTSNTLNGAMGGNAFLTDGGQSNHTISNNEINGNASQPIAYVNGLASVNVASNNVDFLNNTFGGSGTMALGQEASNSQIQQNKFLAATTFTDVEDWEGGNLYNQNNFNDAGLNLQHSENGFTGDNGITNAENNWWGDADPSDGDVSANVDVDFTPFAAIAFP